MNSSNLKSCLTRQTEAGDGRQNLLRGHPARGHLINGCAEVTPVQDVSAPLLTMTSSSRPARREFLTSSGQNNGEEQPPPLFCFCTFELFTWAAP